MQCQWASVKWIPRCVCLFICFIYSVGRLFVLFRHYLFLWWGKKRDSTYVLNCWTNNTLSESRSCLCFRSFLFCCWQINIGYRKAGVGQDLAEAKDLKLQISLLPPLECLHYRRVCQRSGSGLCNTWDQTSSLQNAFWVFCHLSHIHSSTPPFMPRTWHIVPVSWQKCQGQEVTVGLRVRCTM